VRARQALMILKADLACNAGETELARRLLMPVAGERPLPAVQVWRDYFTVWSYLWEGRPVMAVEVGRLQHIRWEAEVGRRGLRAVTLGSLLAAAYWQQDQRDNARVLLADRLDVIEQASGYAGLISAYLTLARLAAADSEEARAFAYLESLAAIGERRGTVRLVVTSLAERIRLHASRQRPAQAAELLAEMSVAVERPAISRLLEPQLHLESELAQALAAVASGEQRLAKSHLDGAKVLAARLNRGYEAIQVLALQALLADRAGESPVALLTEALSRAESGGLVRVFTDTLPDVIDLVRRRTQEGLPGTVKRAFVERVLAASDAARTDQPPPGPQAGNALLTPKEFQVLRLLAGGLPNKRIATELELSNDTVKWHVKKLFAKLNAGSRDHAVDRARMLGLLR